MIYKKYDLSKEVERYYFKQQCSFYLENKKIVELDEIKNTRTNQQNKARWQYLEMVAHLLNDSGQTFTMPIINFEVPYTKENLYKYYWDAYRIQMFPGKTKQLDTKEFSQLVEHVLINFAVEFDIKIDFPDWKRITDEL